MIVEQNLSCLIALYTKYMRMSNSESDTTKKAVYKKFALEVLNCHNQIKANL